MSIRVRVAACVVRDDQILLVTHEKPRGRYHLLPGGGVDDGETLLDALIREVAEETGLRVEPGRLLIVCESIEPNDGRHILNLIYSASVVGGSLAPGRDGTLCDAGWFAKDQWTSLQLFPAIAEEITTCWEENFAGPVLTLGNVWQATDDQ